MKNTYQISGFKIFLLIISFALALLDMSMLKESVLEIIPVGNTMSSVLAFAIATVANCMALDWGLSQTSKEKKKGYNKIGLIGWISFGLVYIVLKCVGADWEEILEEQTEMRIFAGEFIILAASYIFSGLSIQNSAKDIWADDAVACRKAESDYKELLHQLSKEDAKIDKKLSILENYESYYKATRKQYLRHRQAILGAERASCNEILGRTLQECDVEPSVAKEILNEILERREKENKELFNE